MAWLLALAVGTLYACGTYLLLRPNLIQIVLGIGLVSNGVNLLVFTAPGPIPGGVPLIGSSRSTLPVGAGDPLPQALVLTAIVITFAVQAFALVLVQQVHERVGTDDPDDLAIADVVEALEEGWV